MVGRRELIFRVIPNAVAQWQVRHPLQRFSQNKSYNEFNFWSNQPWSLTHTFFPIESLKRRMITNAQAGIWLLIRCHASGQMRKTQWQIKLITKIFIGLIKQSEFHRFCFWIHLRPRTLSFSRRKNQRHSPHARGIFEKYTCMP